MSELLKARIQEDMKTAMKAKASLHLQTIRMLMAAIKQREIDERCTLDDIQIVLVIIKMIKQRQDAAEQYRMALRPELADKELAEITLLEPYLPPQLSEADIKTAIDQAMVTLGASGMKDMGKIIAALKPELEGRADMSRVSQAVKAALQLL